MKKKFFFFFLLSKLKNLAHKVSEYQAQSDTITRFLHKMKVSISTVKRISQDPGITCCQMRTFQVKSPLPTAASAPVQ